MQIYHAIVTANSIAQSKDNKTPSVKIAVRTTHSVPDNEPKTLDLIGDLWLTDKAIDRTLETLAKVFGWSGSSLSELNNPLGSILAGVEVEVVTELEPYNGRDYLKLKYFNRPGESAFQPPSVDTDAAKRLDMQFEGALRKFRTANPNNPTPPPRTTSLRPVGADGLPF